MKSWKRSTKWTIGILAAWLLLLAIYQTGYLSEQGNTNANKYGIVIAFVYTGPLLALWNWRFLRREEKQADEADSDGEG